MTWLHFWFTLLVSDDAMQFAIVTAIDEIGVKNYDMENAYNYPCIRKICNFVSEALMLDPNRVIPVSNYFEEMQCPYSLFGKFVVLDKTILNDIGVKKPYGLIFINNSC